MIRSVSILAIIALAGSAHADNAQLAAARKAIDELRFDEAQRLLVAALSEGDSSPAEVREIYKLAASTAVVLGQREVGEQYYRRWLALDPQASLGANVAPKLREPFEAAQAYIAAHGRMTAIATRVSLDALDVAVSDPLAMAVSAAIAGRAPVALSTEHRARVVPSSAAAVTVAILDEHANRLIELPTSPFDQTGAEPVVRPKDPPAATPAPTTDATFLSTSTEDVWKVLVERKHACETPCSLPLSPRQYVVLESADQSERVDVGYLPAGSVVVRGTPKRNGPRLVGAAFTVLASSAIITGVAITAAGCPAEFGGLCAAGLITLAAGGAGLYGSIQLIRSGSAHASVARGAPEVAATVGGRF